MASPQPRNFLAESDTVGYNCILEAARIAQHTIGLNMSVAYVNINILLQCIVWPYIHYKVILLFFGLFRQSALSFDMNQRSHFLISFDVFTKEFLFI